MPEPLVASPQPTPEHGWRWRRLYAFSVTAAGCWLLRDVIVRTSDPAALRQIALLVVLVIVLQALLYMGGATLTDIWRLVSAVRTTRIINRQEVGS